MILNFFKNNKWLSIAILLGAIIRILFLLYGAEIYFNRPNIFIDGDTWAWQNCIENLINKGVFTVDGENGQFSRMPGYPYFMGIFYLLCNKNWEIAIPAICWTQTLLDVFCIYLMYLLTLKIFKKQKIALIAGFIYATYPFIIVWTPVAYAEQFSIFLLICSLLFFYKSTEKNNSIVYLIITGIILALAGLTRPQLIPLAGILCFVLLFQSKKLIVNLKNSFMIGISFLIVFSLWPLRNYVNHDRFIVTKNADGFLNWQEDVISFMQFTYAVKSEWDPQYTSIINNQKTTYPKIAYGNNKEDSLKLEQAIYLSKNCGAGFSRKSGYWKKIIYENDCNAEIEKLFNELRENQIKNNPLNFYFLVPLKNLKKAIFKSQLYDNKSTYRKIGSLLFYWRTILILIGLTGAIALIKKNKFSYISLLYFGSVYFVLCFGTSPFMRNIEIRYFLPADILLILSSSYLFDKILSFYYVRKIILSKS